MKPNAWLALASIGVLVFAIITMATQPRPEIQPDEEGQVVYTSLAWPHAALELPAGNYPAMGYSYSHNRPGTQIVIIDIDVNDDGTAHSYWVATNYFSTKGTSCSTVSVTADAVVCQ